MKINPGYTIFLTLSLLFSMAVKAQNRENLINPEKDDFGAIIRINPNEKNVYPVFTADSYFEGGEHILQTLEKHKIKGSFFFTGNFLRNSEFQDIIRKIVEQGHYIGPHSDRHLLYCDWQKRDSTLLSFAEFEDDLKNNLAELEKFGIQSEKVPFFIPPYEWYNRQIVEWSRKLGFDVINFTPGTGTNADYTTPEMENYRSSLKLYLGLLQFEKERPNGLNGAILLIHPGTAPARTDKFYRLLEDMVRHFTSKGYRFKSLKQDL